MLNDITSLYEYGCSVVAEAIKIAQANMKLLCAGVHAVNGNSFSPIPREKFKAKHFFILFIIVCLCV